ncbi:MAG TPA: hypothetical protein VGQ46_19075 [Thermoanaerobaculia bacterium]|jgi:hypothetical protein|nr:hypothetical protein [Thermoanaerobaculia bacterium]
MTPGKRKLLGRNIGAMSREAVFETADAIESESREGYEVTRKRVLYEEVLLVTLHRELGAVYVIAMGVFTLIFASVAFSAKREPAVAITFGVLALPFFIACAARVIMKLDFVSVFGRRSKAVMRFSIRKRRAREVYGRICSRALEVQRAMVQAEPEAVPVDEPPTPEHASLQ